MKHSIVTLACATLVCFTALGIPESRADIGMTLKGSHATMKLACASCHGKKQEMESPSEKACLKCHQSRKAIKRKTAKLTPNPHFGHDETVACSTCHKEHEESVLLCDQCHKFKLKTP